MSDEEQEARWMEHFREVLNQPTPPTLFNLDQEPPAPTLNITSDEISGTEVARAIKSLKKKNDQRVWQWTGCQRAARGREGGQKTWRHTFKEDQSP
ncbi:hypothetical protein AAFF_G00181320 [Aldrovandia affinis]|uniref:Uncharacterized protein n=1 Tax=Aldrovandia affinis TaxID=143900 RepID=A0AAD7SZP5_9TELE|nr:hypothetical protein AAFF_G00181320 [Aldrovandia affinis]